MIRGTLERIGSSRATPPIVMLWLALLEGPSTWGGFCLGMAVMMIADVFVWAHYDDVKAGREHGTS